MRRWTRQAPGRHRATGQGDSTASPTEARSPETERALAAAKRAAEDLIQARQVRRKLDRLGDEIDAETSKNGFRHLIEHALGGKA